MNSSLPILVSLVLAFTACGETPVPPPTKPPSDEPCEPKPTDDFTIGVVVDDSQRWFRAFEEDCDTIEMETGLQGGWHIEPALQAPEDAVQSELSGMLRWEVEDENGAVVATAEFEMFKNFWQELEGGLAYWGDFVIFRSNPEALVGTPLKITVELDFDEGGPDDITLTEENVLFVDEKEMTNFR